MTKMDESSTVASPKENYRLEDDQKYHCSLVSRSNLNVSGEADYTKTAAEADFFLWWL